MFKIEGKAHVIVATESGTLLGFLENLTGAHQFYANWYGSGRISYPTFRNRLKTGGELVFLRSDEKILRLQLVVRIAKTDVSNAISSKKALD